MIILPTRTDVPRYTFQIDLDESTFNFSFEWNDRDSSWYMSISDADELPLLMGRRVCVGAPLLDRFNKAGLPAGLLYAIDTTGKNIEPDFADLGDRVKLMYLEAADLA